MSTVLVSLYSLIYNESETPGSVVKWERHRHIGEREGRGVITNDQVVNHPYTVLACVCVW